MIHAAAKWMHALNQDRFLVQSSLQKASGQGVRTHPPMVLSAMYIEKLSRSGSWPFTRYSKLTFFLVWRFLYIVSEARSPSLMRGGLFGLSWWLQGGDRAIVTLWAAVRDLRRWHAIILVLSLCRRRNVGCGRLSGWRSKICLLWSTIRTTYPDRICQLSRCDMAVVRMWCLRVSCASPWGSPDRGSAPRVIRERGPYTAHGLVP